MVSEELVRLPLERAAVAKRPKGLTDQQINEAVLAYEAGDSFTTIGRRLNFSPMTVSLALRKQGVMIRPRPGRALDSALNDFDKARANK